MVRKPLHESTAMRLRICDRGDKGGIRSGASMSALERAPAAIPHIRELPHCAKKRLLSGEFGVYEYSTRQSFQLGLPRTARQSLFYRHTTFGSELREMLDFTRIMEQLVTKKACFVIAPIGEAESDTRKRSDQILKHVISPAVESCGYNATRADQISEPGMITSQVIQKIVDDPLVVADLTERNPNVFYELAISHVIRKPLVQIIKKGEQIPFDVAGARTIHVDHHDLDSV